MERKHHAWNPEKNELLKTSRGVGFEDIVFYIEAGNLLDIVSHPNQAKYPEQKVYAVDIEGYTYLVPFIESEQEVFLKNHYSQPQGYRALFRSPR